MQMIEDGGFYPATLRGVENQILATGEARIYISESRGVFWPQEPVSEDLIIKNATSVETLQGHSFPISGVMKCPGELVFSGLHFDFDLVFEK